MPDDDANAIGVADVRIRVAVWPVGLFPCYKVEAFLQRGVPLLTGGYPVHPVFIHLDHPIDKVVCLFQRGERTLLPAELRYLQITRLFAHVVGVQDIDELAIRLLDVVAFPMTAPRVFLSQFEGNTLPRLVGRRNSYDAVGRVRGIPAFPPNVEQAVCLARPGADIDIAHRSRDVGRWRLTAAAADAG